MKRLGVLRRIKHLLPVFARKIYATEMVIPVLDYANIVWGDNSNKVLMGSIHVLHSRATKIVLDRAPDSDHYPNPFRPEMDESVCQKTLHLYL